MNRFFPPLWYIITRIYFWWLTPDAFDMRKVVLDLNSFSPTHTNKLKSLLKQYFFYAEGTSYHFDTVCVVWAPKKICPNNISSTFLRSSFSIFSLYFLVNRSNFQCNSFPESAFSANLGFPQPPHDEGWGRGESVH